MKTIGVTEARADLYNLIALTARTSQPIQIISKRGNAVLISEEDWNALQETNFLNSIPGMARSIREGMQAKEDEFVNADEVQW